MSATTYDIRREALTTYFDRTAADAWEKLTSDAPVSKIRATVRVGRDRMRALLLSRLPEDMTGMRLLDAGCGTGALSVEAARRGAGVTAIDVSPRMIEIARERIGNSPFGPSLSRPGSFSADGEERTASFDRRLAADAQDRLGQAQGERAGIDFRAGDMLDPALGRFDHVVAMDSLIHYRKEDILTALAGLAARTERSILFTIAPRTPLLTVMHAVGKLFPRGDRSPAIEPVAAGGLARAIERDPRFAGWHVAMSERINSGFYMSQAMELVRG